jgi:hypothetical protein
MSTAGATSATAVSLPSSALVSLDKSLTTSERSGLQLQACSVGELRCVSDASTAADEAIVKTRADITAAAQPLKAGECRSALAKTDAVLRSEQMHVRDVVAAANSKSSAPQTAAHAQQSKDSAAARGALAGAIKSCR